MDNLRSEEDKQSLLALIQPLSGGVAYSLSCNACGSTNLTFPPIVWTVQDRPGWTKVHVPDPPTCNTCGNVGASLQKQPTKPQEPISAPPSTSGG